MQLLENYLPTIIATLIEPLWVLLNRLLCVLQPFQDLAAGHATQQRSIKATYTAIPAQLVIWRAFKARHFTLIVVCITALVANLLGIGLAALLNEDQVEIQYPSSFRPILTPNFTQEGIDRFVNISFGGSRGGYRDPLFYAIANESQGTRLPPWVSQDYFFLPHDLKSPSTSSNATRNILQAPGFGAAWSCKTQSATTMPPNPPLRIPDLYEPEICADPFEVLTSEVLVDKNSSQAQPPGPWGKAISFDMCNGTYVLAWARMKNGTGGGDESRTIQSSFAACRWSMDTGLFNITTDSCGYVVSYEKVGGLHYPPGGTNSSQLSYALLSQFNTIIKGDLVTWHNSSTTTDWLNYLVALRTKTRAFLDPKQPPPDPEPLSGEIGAVYRMLFAITLGLQQTTIFESSNPDSNLVDGTRVVTETRIFLDQSALVITLTVLSCDVVMAIWFYGRMKSVSIPRMPNSLGSMFAYLAATRDASFSPHSIEEPASNNTYSFGRFLGTDGKTHVGIEADPHVVSLSEPRSTAGWNRAQGASPSDSVVRQRLNRPNFAMI